MVAQKLIWHYILFQLNIARGEQYLHYIYIYIYIYNIYNIYIYIGCHVHTSIGHVFQTKSCFAMHTPGRNYKEQIPAITKSLTKQKRNGLCVCVCLNINIVT